MQKTQPKKEIHPPQTQVRPRKESQMHPRPQTDPRDFTGGRLSGKVTLIMGGDSGIGKAVALLLTKEGSDVAVVYLSEKQDAQKTRQQIQAYGRLCELIQGDISAKDFCEKAIRKVKKNLAGLTY